MSVERKIDLHHTNPCNEQIGIVAIGEPGAGGASVRYKISGPSRDWSPNVGLVTNFQIDLRFQNGPVADGVNGITNEVLLAILTDRLIAFQKGPFACEENEQALEHISRAFNVLARRTSRRQGEGTEGTHKGS